MSTVARGDLADRDPAPVRSRRSRDHVPLPPRNRQHRDHPSRPPATRTDDPRRSATPARPLIAVRFLRLRRTVTPWDVSRPHVPLGVHGGRHALDTGESAAIRASPTRSSSGCPCLRTSDRANVRLDVWRRQAGASLGRRQLDAPCEDRPKARTWPKRRRCSTALQAPRDGQRAIELCRVGRLFRRGDRGRLSGLAGGRLGNLCVEGEVRVVAGGVGHNAAYAYREAVLAAMDAVVSADASYLGDQPLEFADSGPADRDLNALRRSLEDCGERAGPESYLLGGHPDLYCAGVVQEPQAAGQRQF